MNAETINRLRELNNRFYDQYADSFSETRGHAWPGWKRVLSDVRNEPKSVKTVIDIAGGNCRFEKYCIENGLHDTKFHVVDSCPALAPEIPNTTFQFLDVIECLLSSKQLDKEICSNPADLVVSFGFLHHVPDEVLRTTFLRQLVSIASPSGIIAITFWQFAKNPRLAEKAIATTDAACRELGLVLDENDFILGWKGAEGAYRYCHSFTDGEVERIVRLISDCAELVDCFSEDGKTGDMNKYVVVRRHM